MSDGKILHRAMRSIISELKVGNTGVLLLGSGGRLGRMLRLHWPAPHSLRLQSRQAASGVLCFDPLRDTDALERAAEGVQAVICLAGVTPAHATATGDAMALNTGLALAAVRAAPVDARVFVASSAAVYGADGGLHRETDDVVPVSGYGHAKRAMEQAALEAGAGRVCVLRIGNVAGADAILGGWRAGMTIDQLPDGRTPRRSYIGPVTLAKALHALCGADALPDIVNIAAPGAVAMGDLLDAAGLVWTPRTAGSDVIGEVTLDTARLERVYTFEPSESTPQGLVAQWRKGEGRT